MGGKILENPARDILNQGVEKGRAEGVKEGRSEGAWTMLCDLVKKGLLSMSAAANQVDMSETDFKEKYEKYMKTF